MEGDDINKSPKKGLKLDGDTIDPHESAIETEFIPILQHLVDNEALDFGWHRTAERLSQGLCPAKSLSAQLEPFEKQLVMMELALIAGSDLKHITSNDLSRILSKAWGRDPNFQKTMISNHCERKGDFERKRRNDAGTPKMKKKRVEEEKTTMQQQEFFASMGGANGNQYQYDDAQQPLPPPMPVVAEAIMEPSIDDITTGV